MRETLKYLKKDRKVNEEFEAKLEKVGFEIEYGTFEYWDNKPYVQIGRQRVYLMESLTMNGSTGIVKRYQNEVIEEIENVIEEQVRGAEIADAKVEEFFEKLSKTE